MDENQVVAQDELQPVVPVEDTEQLAPDVADMEVLPSAIKTPEAATAMRPEEQTMAATSMNLAAEAAGIDPQTVNSNNPNDVFRLLESAFKLKGEARKSAVLKVLADPNISPTVRAYVGEQLVNADMQDRAVRSVEDVYRGAAYVNEMREEALVAREGVLDSALPEVQFGATPQGRGIQMAARSVSSPKQAAAVARTKVAITKEDVYREATALRDYVDKRVELSDLINPFNWTKAVGDDAEGRVQEGLSGTGRWLKTLASVGQLVAPFVGAVNLEAQALAGAANTSGIPELKAIVDKWGVGNVRAGQATLNVGQFNRDIRATVNNLPPEKQLQLIRALKTWHDTEGYKKLTGGNGFIEQSIVEKLIGDLLVAPGQERTRTDVIMQYGFDHLETGVGWLEATGVGLGLSSAIKTTKLAARGGLRNVFGLGEYARMARVAPETTSVGVAKAVIDGDASVKALGLGDKGEIIEQAMPTGKAMLEQANSRTNILQSLKEQVLASQSQIFGNISKILGTHVVPLSPNRAAAGIAEKLGRYHMVHRPDLSTIEAGIEVAEDGAKISGLYGRSQEEGYRSLEELREATARMFGTDEDGAVQLVLRHKDSGALIRQSDDEFAELSSEVAAVPELAKEFEWFAQVDQSIPTSELANWDEVIPYDFITTKTFKEEPPPKGVIEAAGRKIRNFARAPALQKLHRNINSIYSMWMQDVGGALKQAEGNQRVAQDLVMAMFSPELSKLNKADALNLNRAIEAGQGNPARLTDEQLETSFNIKSNEGKLAYFAFRNATEFMYKIANLKASSSYAKEGYYHIYALDGQRVGFGRPIRGSVDMLVDERSALKSVPVRVIDGETEQVVRMSTGEIDTAIRDAGDTFYSMSQAEFVGADEVGYTLVKQGSNARHTRRVRSGDKVIDYVDGYYTNAVNAPIAIRARTASGRRYLLGTANTMADAEKAVAELKANPEVAGKYGMNIEPEPMGGYRDYIASAKGTREMYENWGGRVFGRKDSVQGKGPIDFSNREKPANFEAPVEATIKSFMMLAGVYTKGEMIQFMERALGKHAAEFDLLRNPGSRKVGSVDDLISMDEARRRGDDIADALDNAYTTLKTIQGYSLLPDAAAALQSRVIRKIGAWVGKTFSGKVGQAIEKKAYELSQSSASDVTIQTTRFNYFRKIRMNPISARMLNLSQMLANAGTPISMGRAVVARDAFLTVLSSTLDAMRGGKSWDDAYKTLDKTYVKALAKVSGFTPDEFGKLARAYVESGTWHRVTHNDMRGLGMLSEEQLMAMKSAETPADSVAGRLYGIAGRTGNSALKLLDSIGIYGGEHEASMITYLTQYLNLKKQPGFDITKQQSQQELAGITNSLMGEMTPEGRVWMQRGWWKLSTQFLAFPYKMFMMLTPGSMQLTPAQKMGVMLSQSLLLGGDALWHIGKAKEALQSAILDDTDLTKEEHEQLLEDYKQIEPLVEQGLLGAYMNRLLQGIVAAVNSDVVDDPTYTYQEYGFGERFSLGASPVDSLEKVAAVAGLVNAAVNMNMPDTVDVLDATVGSLPKDIVQFSNRTSKLWGMTNDKDVEARNDAFVAISKEALEQITPMATQYYKLKAQQRYQEEITSRGLRNVAFENTADTWVTTALGVRTLDDIEATQSAWSAFYKQEAKEGNQAAQVKEQGDKIFDAVFELVTKVPKTDEGFTVREAMLNRHNALIKSLYAMMPEGDAQQVQMYVINKIDEEVAKGSPQGKQIREFMGEVEGLADDDGGLGRVLYMLRQRSTEMSPILQQRLEQKRDEYEQNNSRYQ